MPNRLLEIADSQYADAATQIAAFRVKRGETGVNTEDIEKVLRAYVYLGESKEIVDWNYALSEDTKGNIAHQVSTQTDEVYGFLPSEQKVYVDLQILELLASQGLVAPNVAQPRLWQTRYETDSLPTVTDQTGFFYNVKKGVESFFEVARQTIESAFKGLGLDIPLPLILALAAAAVLAIVSASKRAV